MLEDNRLNNNNTISTSLKPDSILQNLSKDDDNSKYNMSNPSSETSPREGANLKIAESRKRILSDQQLHELYCKLYEGMRPLTGVERPELKNDTRLLPKSTSFWCSFDFWLLLLQFLIAILLLLQVIYLTHYDFVYRRDAYKDWNNILFPANLAPTDYINRQVDLITQNQTVETVKRILQTYYYVLPHDSIDFYQRPTSANGSILPVTLSVFQNNVSKISLQKKKNPNLNHS